MIRRFNIRQLRLAACAAAVALAVALPATAQSTGIVKGVVLDATGAPVENAVVKIVSTSSNRSFDVKSNKPYAHMDLSGPVMGFVDMAKGMGVAGTHITKADDIKAAVAAAFKSGKPHLLEIEIEGKR